MKKEENILNYPEIQKTRDAFYQRTNILVKEDSEIQNAFMQKDFFWKNQKEDMSKNIEAIESKIKKIMFDMQNTKILTEKIISEFRNKVKSENLEKTKDIIANWTLEEFITDDRLRILTRKIMAQKHFQDLK